MCTACARHRRYLTAPRSWSTTTKNQTSDGYTQTFVACMSRVCIGPGTNYTTAVAVGGREASNLITSPERERKGEREKGRGRERERDTEREREKERNPRLLRSIAVTSSRLLPLHPPAGPLEPWLPPASGSISSAAPSSSTSSPKLFASSPRSAAEMLRVRGLAEENLVLKPPFSYLLYPWGRRRVCSPFACTETNTRPVQHSALMPLSLSRSLFLSLPFVPRSPPPFHFFSASTPLVVFPLLWRRKRLLFTLYFKTNTIPTFAKVMAMLVGMAALVARRLALMRDHWAASKPGVGKTADDPGATGVPNRPSKETVATAAAAKGESSSGASAAVSFCGGGGGGGSGGIRGGSEVMEAGVFLLALEVSAMLWLVGGWSSLVALRFRCTFRVYRRDSENAEAPLLTHFSI